MHPVTAMLMVLAAPVALGSTAEELAAKNVPQPGVGRISCTRSSRCASPARYWSTAARSSSGTCVC